MKKSYNVFVSRRNTPNLDLYTRLIRLFYGFSGINPIITAIACFKSVSESTIYLCILGVIFLAAGHDDATSQLREKRNLTATVLAGIFHFLITLPLIIIFRFAFLAVIYVLEWIVCIGVILYYFRDRWGRKR